MKNGYLLICTVFFITLQSSFSQLGTWTWISGDSTANAGAVFGVKNNPSPNNHPPAMYDALQWKDKQGNFWLYGGTDTLGGNTDLWKFNPVSVQWTWVKGNGIHDQPMHGSKGVSNALNTPGSRTNTVPSWVDTSGAFWLCGGAGHGDDTWKYDIGTGNWTWIAGDTTPNIKSNHGTLRVTGASVTPGNRYATCSAWTDSLNNLWLFGGFGFDDSSNGGGFNDLMKFNVASKQWTWMNGSYLRNPDGIYGIKGISAPANEPPGRFPSTSWKDETGNLWTMGGLIWTNSLLDPISDVWKYDVSADEWTWMAGPNTLNDTGYFNTSCIYDTVNTPYARWYQRSSVTDSCGRFWMFGGGRGLFSLNTLANDLWVFDPQQAKWNLARGNYMSDQPAGNYGVKGVPSASNVPSGRAGANVWWGNDNKFYLFGGADDYGNVRADMWVFTPDTSCIPSCTAVIPPPIAAFKADSTTFCANGCIDFTDLSTNATAWKWKFSGAADSISYTQNPLNICYPDSGIFDVTLFVYNAGGKDSVTLINYIKVAGTPPAPDIKQYNDTLLYISKNSSYIHYQWYLDSVIISGATDTLLIINHSGNYTVEVRNASGCEIASSINILLTALATQSNNNSIYIFPNPAENKLFVSCKRPGVKEIMIYNVLGEICYLDETTNPVSAIDVSSIPPGIYFITIKNERDKRTGKFVKY